MDVDDPNEKKPMESVTEKLDELAKPKREHKPLERTYREKALLEKTLEEARIEPPPRQVTLLKKGIPKPKKQDSGGKPRLNPLAKEFRPGQASMIQCNMVVFLPSELEVKNNNLTAMEGDMVEMGEIAEILKESLNSGLNGGGPSVVILKDEDGNGTENRAASVIFEKLTSKMTKHIKPLYISGCVDGMPITRLLVDNGSAANLMPRSTMIKLGKTDQDLVSSTATLTDFTGQETSCQGILIMNLTIGSKTLTTPFFVVNSRSSFNILLGRDWIHACLAVPSTLHQCLIFWNQEDVEVVWADRRPFHASTNHAEARLYDEDVGLMKVAGLDRFGRHKIVPVSAHKSVEEVKAFYQELIGPMITESSRPITASTKRSFKCLNKNDDEVINEDLDLVEDLDEIRLEDLEAAPAKLDDLKADVQDPLEEVNLGDSENPWPVYISQLLPEDVKRKLIQLLMEFKSCFAWNYDELPGLSRDLVEHKLPIQAGFRPFKQPPRRMSNEVYLQVKEEIERLFNAGFIRTARYVTWLSNVVPVLKKNGKIRVCVDFRNLNLASPKDEYPTPVADLCPGALGTFEWVVMPFGLKNVGASFQRAMNAYFHYFIGRFMEIYVDDIVVKSQSYDEHLEHLRSSFLRMQQFDLKVNPLKCAFGVSAGKFLGFLVHNRGIEVDKNKAKAVMEAKPPTTKKELQKLLGSFNFLRRFISNMAGKVQVFSQLLKLKDQDTFVWEASHQKAFDEIKGYLAKAPVLMPPIKNKPLKLYISAAENSIGCLLAQDNEQGKEQAVYYLSRLLTSCERRYTPIEKFCLALYFATIKLRHYMLPVVVYIMSQTDLIKYLLSRPIMRGRIGKWSLALMEFNFRYIPQKAVMGQALADFLADHPCVDIGEESDIGLSALEVSFTPWTLLFDGSKTQMVSGCGVIIISPQGLRTELSFQFDFPCTNNQAEYEAVIIGLEILRDLEAKEVRVIGDSNLVINHLAV
ncbi:uncharacterized protein LOC131323676 [Rhododendron vialii]|uniref:uncharacterized protein LOC131323676 n=1 Tax=Rhododendron vialii TaxID=182163 RepID=UPI00265EF12D|nr:uncharacterized protein LOC131323676 [Rhododendron vialii]